MFMWRILRARPPRSPNRGAVPAGRLGNPGHRGRAGSSCLLLARAARKEGSQQASDVPVRPVEATPLGEADALDEVADSGLAHPLGELHVPQRVVALADDP